MSESPLRVLVVDDNRTAADAVALLLGREGHRADVCHEGGAAISRLTPGAYDLVLTDLRMEPVDGLAVVRAARACDPAVDCIVFTAYGSVDAAVEAMRYGALDFLTKPVSAEQLLTRIRALHRRPSAEADIVGTGAAMVRLRRQVEKLATVRSTVLCTGETGTGRRHIARWLHNHGLDKDRPMLLARPGGWFTAGELDAAGTLLVAGVDEWSAEAQGTLVRQLEAIEPGRPPRIVATASPEIGERARDGSLRSDLYFRLAVLELSVPPLRERPMDIAPLVDHFIALRASELDQDPIRPSGGQLTLLATHSWPGNVQEVANLAERAVVMGDSAFEMRVRPRVEAGPGLPTLAEGFNLSSWLEEMERLVLVRAIEQTNGDRPAMSRLLGLERNTLRYKLNKYDLLRKT